MQTKSLTFKSSLLYLALFVFLSIYILFQARNLLIGPVISVHTPTNGAGVIGSTVTVAGNTKNINHITLNDRKIFVDKDGVFQEQLLLPMGYTVFTIAATDRFGREVKEYIELVRTN